MFASLIHRIVPAARRFAIGRDREGRWIARDEQGRSGGVFADRDSAVRFAVAESGHRPGAIRFATRRLPLFG